MVERNGVQTVTSVCDQTRLHNTHRPNAFNTGHEGYRCAPIENDIIVGLCGLTEVIYVCKENYGQLWNTVPRTSPYARQLSTRLVNTFTSSRIHFEYSILLPSPTTRLASA